MMLPVFNLKVDRIPYAFHRLTVLVPLTIGSLCLKTSPLIQFLSPPLECIPAAVVSEGGLSPWISPQFISGLHRGTNICANI